MCYPLLPEQHGHKLRRIPGSFVFIKSNSKYTEEEEIR